jgi:hypothetical protein
MKVPACGAELAERADLNMGTSRNTGDVLQQENSQ